MKNVLVAGGSGALGQAWVKHFLARPDVGSVVATWHRRAPPVIDPRLVWVQVDLTDEDSVSQLSDVVQTLDSVICAAGFLHGEDCQPEKSIRDCSPERLLKNIQLNTLPAMLLALTLQKALRHERPSHFAVISAKVGSIEDNRLGGWYSYRASKAALNMFLKTLSLEWRRSLPKVCVSSLHPGTVESGLSAPFASRVLPEKLFTPDYSVACMASVLERLAPDDTGGFWSWNGERLPW
jgi:NAD(P)-dependent dehydrogenase (short-subunit alcohol dehydrogenase family)